MKNSPSYRELLKKFKALPKEIRDFFPDLPILIQDHLYEVALAYLFLRTEMAQNRTLYGGVVKLHRAHKDVAQSILNSQHITRKGFKEFYRNIFGEVWPPEISDKLEQAVRVRDKVIHGKSVPDTKMREAIFVVLDYAVRMNTHMQSKAGFRPFGDMRGFKGAAIPLDKGTTGWLLKGMGFGIAPGK